MKTQQNFEHVKVGDTVTRMLAGTVPMLQEVGKVDETFIYTFNDRVPLEEGWKFRRSNGAEVDEELGWDGITVTGSYLIHEQNQEK